MTTDPGIRASDEDRGRTAAALGEHYAAGRLTLEEFQERLDQAYAATTLGELRDLMADLPVRDLGRFPALPGGKPPLAPWQAPGSPQIPAGGSPPALPASWRFWLAISLGVFVIWLFSGAAGGPWLLWIALALGFLVARRWIHGGPPRGERHSARSRRARR